MVKAKYLKLGKTATSFYDPILKLKISANGVAKLEFKETRRLKNAIKHGHLEEATEKEYKAWLSSQENPEKVEESSQGGQLKLDSLNSNQLTTYYKGNYQVSEEDVKTFDKMTKKDKLKFLTEAEEEDEEDEEEEA